MAALIGSRLVWVERAKTWLWRYLPAELVCTPMALLCAWLAAANNSNPALAAIAGTWGEIIGFYGMMLVREWITHRNLRAMPLVIGRLMLEFGPAEALDSMLLRPMFMYLAVTFSHNLMIGIVIGKLAADITFYIPAIISYELLRRHAPAS